MTGSSWQWRQAEIIERNRTIWDAEFEDFVPEQVLDLHVHISGPGAIPDDKPFNCAGQAMTAYTLDDLRNDLSVFYPGRECSAVCFGLPFIQFNTQRSNQYLAEQCDNEQFFALRLFDAEEDTAESVLADLASGRFRGLKPYHNYVRRKTERDVEIHDMLPPWVMEIANEKRLLVMLHIPRPGRLADPVNQRQIVELCTRHPDATIILAHIGRAYYLRNITGQTESLAPLLNLYYDIAMLNNHDVLEYAFAHLPAERLLYATDAPIGFALGKSVEINHQYTYITPEPWELSVHDAVPRIRYTSFLYEELRSIRRAVERLGLGGDFIQALFHDNGARLLRINADGKA